MYDILYGARCTRLFVTSEDFQIALFALFHYGLEIPWLQHR